MMTTFALGCRSCCCWLQQPAHSRAAAKRALFSTTSSDSSKQLLFAESIGKTQATSDEITPQLSAKEKRKRLYGVAKAVDRGQFANVYQPLLNISARSGLPDRRQLFTVLGIESSCDDTGAAVVRSDGVILGQALASQGTIHEPFGGVVPGLARDAHALNLEQVISEALANASMTSVNQVDAIGVTVGPGLEICLRVGCDRARELAIAYNKPFVGVHHLEAHILVARMPLEGGSDTNVCESPATSETHATFRAMEFPFLAMLVSGGHCQLLRCDGVGNHTILGGTMDDSLGEAFDKTARLIGLPVGGGGGPAVEKLAREGDPNAISLSVPLHARKDCDFSYSGLKSNVMRSASRLMKERHVETPQELPRQDKANIAASFQNVAIKHIEQRLKYAMNSLEPDGIRKLAVVGGVAANTELRNRLEALCLGREEPWEMFVPPPRLCTDQGAMSAWAAVERLMLGSSDDPHMQEVYARYPFATKK
jgi:N6-L-threonylcarbamoyladenine synthase